MLLLLITHKLIRSTRKNHVFDVINELGAHMNIKQMYADCEAGGSSWF